MKLGPLTTILVVATAVCFILTGCPETQQMMKPAMSEPADTEPTTLETPPATDKPAVTMGEVKTEPEPATPEPDAEPAEEPTVDTTPPTVVSVTYYRDASLAEPVTKITVEDIIFAKVTFSEPMQVEEGDPHGLPELRFLAQSTEGGRYIVPGAFKMLSSDSELTHGEAKPLEGATTFLCKYEITGYPHSGIFRGVFRVVVGTKSADLAGNRMERFQDEDGLAMESRDIEALEAYAQQLSTLPERTPPVITEFIVPEHLWDQEPEARPGYFTGRILVPRDVVGSGYRSEAKPTTGATVTVMAGPQAGQKVATDPAGYYYIKTEEKQLHLRVEKEWFEPKEVIVSRSEATMLANGDRMNHWKDPQHQSGVILIGQQWPDEVRYLLEEMVVVHDLLYFEAGDKYEFSGAYSGGVVVIFDGIPTDTHGMARRINIFAEEIIHAHQDAQTARDGRGSVDDWEHTPEGIAFLAARERDWQEYGKLPGFGQYRLIPAENAAAIGKWFLGKETWKRFGGYNLREIIAMTPHRQAWAAEWLLKK